MSKLDRLFVEYKVIHVRFQDNKTEDILNEVSKDRSGWVYKNFIGKDEFGGYLVFEKMS